MIEWCVSCGFFFFQAEDGIRDLVRSRGLGDVYKRQALVRAFTLIRADGCDLANADEDDITYWLERVLENLSLIHI